ncbi:TPA: transcriptional regulator [Serratia marcescens]
MIFIINKSVLYNEEEGTLAHIDNANNKVALLKPAGRLLSLFIRNNGTLLLREKLINDVWVDHGLKASNNNLNNYVSGLRKSLAQCGIEEIIVTYPRQGFKFCAINIDKSDKFDGSDNDLKYDSEEKTAIAEPKIEPTNLRRLLQRLVMIAAACLVPFALVILYQNSTRISVYPLGNYEQCQIYSMKLESGDLRRIKNIIHQAGFNCKTRADVYYYDNIRSADSQNAEEQLTFCPREISAPCINSYINNNN